MNYNDPVGGTDSTVGSQIRTDFYNKKSLIEAQKEQYFSQLADVTSMPKNMGKKIKRYHYLPLLDDANINDQGIDADGNVANGSVGLYKATVKMYPTAGKAGNIAADHLDVYYFTSEHLTSATALTAAEAKAEAFVVTLGFANTAAAVAAGWSSTHTTGGDLTPLVPVDATGNLYGSSKDVGTISGKLPALSENGGRVNRVGFKRIEIEADITKLGFFDEYTQESIDFDSDAE